MRICFGAFVFVYYKVWGVPMIRAFGLDKQNEWERIITAFQDHDVYYLPQYAKAFKIHGDGEPLLIYFESGGTRAANVVMKRDISDCADFAALEKGAFFDLSTPYGYGGFLIEGDGGETAVSALDEEYSQYCRSENIVSEFVRFHPLLGNHSGLEPMYGMTGMGSTVSVDLSSPEVIDANIKARTRNRIRKAKSAGIMIRSGYAWELFLKFKELYEPTMDRNNAKKYYYFKEDHYRSVYEGLKDNCLIFYAELNGEIIAMEILLHCNSKMHLHLTSYDERYLNLSPVAFMYYETALWGTRNGFKSLHLGGGVGASEDSLYRFKTNFNAGGSLRFFTGRKIFDAEKYKYLLETRGKEAGFAPAPGFFPEYRSVCG